MMNKRIWGVITKEEVVDLSCALMRMASVNYDVPGSDMTANYHVQSYWRQLHYDLMKLLTDAEVDVKQFSGDCLNVGATIRNQAPFHSEVNKHLHLADVCYRVFDEFGI